MRTVTTVEGLRRRVAVARAQGRRIGLVPTMGALHEGHLALVRAAAADGRGHGTSFVATSIFVNPTQFGPGEDYDAYPQDLDSDLEALDALGRDAPDLVYAPSVQEMYPGWRRGDEPFTLTTVSVARLTRRLCGASRPGHFDGVCTVVVKLLHQAAPDVAFFGRKDFQQLQVIRRMVADLDEPVQVVGVPTVREDDGVAMSSRNDYLDEEDRRAATCLSRGLVAAVRTARRLRSSGEQPTPAVLRDAALARIRDEPRARVDYVDVVDPETLEPPDDTGDDTGRDTGDDTGEDAGPPRRLLVAVAAHVGQARLIDNVVVGEETDEQRLLDAAG